MEAAGYFPLFVDIRGKKVLIVGAGTIASRRVRTLVQFGADVTVIAPELSEEIQMLEHQGALTVCQKIFSQSDCQGYWMILAATSDAQVNRAVCVCGRNAGAIVNNASDRSECDFYFPGIIRDEDSVIGISAGGKNHRHAKELRLQIEAVLKKNKKRMSV